jgi:GMP reductase
MANKQFNFEHMNLVPRKCIVESRAECDPSVQFGKFTWKLPVVPANMECVINEEIAERLAKAGYFYVLHRFNINEIEFAKNMKSQGLPISISLGVNEDSYTLLKKMVIDLVKPDYITIDIAHGHSIKMERMLKWIKCQFVHPPFIIAGNVSTPEAVRDLEAWGADAIKVGIGPGSACTTYTATGFGSRGAQASIIADCKAAATKAVIVADGGIQNPGDIAKSLALGASMVMIGGMFSALADSPGNVVIGTDGRQYKEFWGSASAHATGKTGRIEGTKKLMLMNTKTIADEMDFLTECLQSAISYGGGKTLACFKDVRFILHDKP